ncbi:MAG TPA: hypothetical protein VEY10_21575, partial [Flavisolibacter sp.]|nr:hypothetical protein [Flavisolibacter sp.]
NTITFSAVTGVTSIIVKATKGAVSDFPFGAAINREYDITVPAGSYTATLRLHYEDAQINGSAEHGLTMWRYNGATWLNLNKSANDATANYVELTGLTDITNRWTLSDNASVVRWTGAVSTDWLNAGNWASVQGTPSLPPSSSDIVQIGFTSFTNQPSIASSATAKSISFGSTQAVSLTIQNSGSLFVSGNINGTWSANATHTITNSGSLTANGNLDLSDGTTGHQVNFTSNLGTTIVRGSITQSGNADVALLGVTSFSIGDDYNYTSGSFSAGLGTVNYNGTVVQTVAPLSYYNLTVNKASGNAEINAATSIANTLTIGSGTLDVFANTTVVADVTIAPGASLVAESNSISVGGNWNNSGSFNPGTGTISFNGTGGQTISSSTFNQLIINKPSGTAVLSGNLAINSNLTIGAGVLNLSAYTVNRTTRGGSFIMGDATSLLAGGASNFPANFSVYSLHGNSTVEYNSLVSQAVEGVSYGHVVFSNGGSNTKTLSASAVISGNITINSGASLASGTNTINLYGNWVNNGSFDPGTGAILFSGTAKTISGNSSFYRVSVYGSYTVSGSDITFLNNFRILSGGSYDAGTGSASVQGDLTNSGSLTSNGTTTFAGTQLQTIRLLNAITSNSSGVINFNGTVSPVLNSTSTPTFATLNINNTGGISPSVNWSVFVAFTVNNGAVFNGGAVTHNFYGSFTNNGTITSSGVLNIAPVSPQTIKLAGTGFSSTGVVQFGGSSALSVTGTTAILTDVTISNTTGVSPATGWTINRNFSIGSAGIFNAGSNTYTVGGDVQSNGTLNGETSTFTLTSANGQISGSPATTFYHLIVSGALITANSDFNIDGNLATNGTLDVSLGQVHFTGSADAAITGSTSALAQFSIEKSTGSTVSLAKSITAVAAMDILSGIFDEGAYTITQDAGGGKLTLANTAFLKIGGINTLPVFTTYAIDTFSTVDYNGATQTISNASPYGNLTLSSAGTKTAAAALVILNNFSLVNAGFVAGSHTHTAGGNWTMISGSFTNTGNTIVFNGTANQSISSTGAFNNITVNKTSGLITLSSPVNVNGVLSLTSGKISLGNHSLTMGSTASITNASTANYIIAEGTGTLTQPVVAGGTKIFPVGRTIAYLPATLTLTAGSTTDNFSLRVLNGAYTDGSTGIAVTTNAVNTSWVITEAVAGGTNATVLLQWPLSLELPGFTRSFSRLARYTGTAWDYGTGDIAAAGVNPYTVSRSNFTATGVFAVSSYDGVLPVTWLSINGINEGKNNHLYWSTSSNQNNRYFSIEASNDGRNFAAVGRVKTAVGSATTQSYNFIEQDVTQTIRYYRIKQVDHDESFSYSRTVAIKSGAIQSMAMQSTFTGNGLQVYITSNKNTEASLVLYDGAGKMLYLKRIRITRGFNDFMVQPGHLSAGIYFVYLQANDGTIQIFKLTK